MARAGSGKASVLGLNFDLPPERSKGNGMQAGLAGPEIPSGDSCLSAGHISSFRSVILMENETVPA
jgi:hypothetical protein